MTATNFMRSAIAEQSMPTKALAELRADVVWLRDYMDEHSVGSADERQLLRDLAAVMCAAIALEP